MRQSALGDIIRKRVEDSPSAAEAWMRGLPAGNIRDGVVVCMVACESSDSPAHAADFLALIADPEKRERAASSLLHEWMRADKAAAIGWLRTTPSLSSEAREKLLSE